MVREWAETVVVVGAALATIGGVLWAFGRHSIDRWIVGAIQREPAKFKEVSGEVWAMDIQRWEEAYTLAKDTYHHVTRIARDVSRLAERDEEFTELRADVTQLKRESEHQVDLLKTIVDDVQRTRESVARIEGALDVKRRRGRDD
jgi:hypothetical protein